MEPLEQKLTDLNSELKSFTAKAQEDIRSFGAVATETKTALDTIRTQMTAMQSQLDAVDAKTQVRHVDAPEQKTIGDMVIGSAEFAEAKKADFISKKPLYMVFEQSAFPLSLKTDITETNIGSATTGVLVQQRIPGVFVMPQQALRIRDVMRVFPATGSSFDYVYESTHTNVASPQTEGSAKSQSYYNWSSASGSIRTIAHYVNVSRQALSDIPWLRGQIDANLIYGLKVKEESEILSGDGTGVHLSGIITGATAFDTSYLNDTAGWTRLDILRWGKLQARLAGLATYAPSAFVIHPTDLTKIETTKDTTGLYIVGDPKTGTEVKFIWGLPVVESDSITAGTFLVGAFNTAAYLMDRQAVSVEISYEHSDNFTKNLASILAEERIGLAITKATAFITGSLATTSPAS